MCRETCLESKRRRRWDGEIVVRRSRKPRCEKRERRRGRELSATLLPVLVKCCVLSKRQPRMCQPSRLTLPNGLLNADIKLTRSFALLFPLSLSPSLFLPLPLALITSRSHPVPHSVTHLSSPSFSFFLLLCLSTSRFLSFPLFPVAVFLLLLISPSITPSSPLKLSCRLSLYLQLFFMDELNTSVSLSLPLSSNRLHNAFYPQDPFFSLTLLHVLSAPLHGLANAFVFGLDRDWWSLLSPTGMQVQQLHTHTSIAPFRHANQYVNVLAIPCNV